MRRIVALVALFTLVPASAVSAGELDELLERSHEASYSAEQIISCSTPDGVRDAVVRIAQSGQEIRVSSAADEGVEVASGSGGWTLSRQGGVVSSASVDATEEPVDPLYSVEDRGDVDFLGREAMAYRLIRERVIRAELVFDNETGALVEAVTYSADGSSYCLRRFVSFDDSEPNLSPAPHQLSDGLKPEKIETSLPESVEGFQRLDSYQDEEGFRFVYYSDGFFSFAVFETPTKVHLADGVDVELGDSVYRRFFTAGQVTLVWETRAGGMALVGDLPPDLHESVLANLPQPENPGLFRRLWRRLFG